MKKCLKLLCVFSLVILATGCVKMNFTMKINSDKSMDFKIIEAISDQLSQYSTKNLLSDKDKKDLEKNGFKVENYSKDGMSGFTVSKRIKSIDDVSTTKSIKGNLSLKEADGAMFTVKKGFFKNTYEANLKSSDTSSVSSQMNSNDTTTTDTEDTTESDDSSDTSSFGDYSKYMSSMDMSFKLTLPNKSISNNATEVSKDGKTLTWNLLTSQDGIKFKFSMYNMTNIYIVVAAGILLVAGIVVLIVVLTKKKKSN